jgi:hypothetical protein
VKFAKIQFAERNVAAKALVGLAQRSRITVLADHVFIVPDAALEWLTAQTLPYTLLQGVNYDDVIQALRNLPPHAV